MGKHRIEALSDGVFAIVMTILILEMKVPEAHGIIISNDLLWHKLKDLWPIFRSYLISFLILGMFWNAHHGFFHIFTKEVDRLIAFVNVVYLMIISCLPFSAHLLGQYPTNYPAFIVYGGNIILAGLVLFIMFQIAVFKSRLLHDHVSKRLIVQATIRIWLPIIFAGLGILVSSISYSLSFILFAFPIIFNFIPGSIDIFEKAYKVGTKNQTKSKGD